MKKILSLVCLIFLTGILWAQSDETKSDQKSFKQQIGTNISPLFRNLFKPNLRVNSFFDVPYILNFKSIRKNNNRAFRFAIGGDIKREISNDNSDDNVKQNSFRISMGFEKQKKVSKRWQINSGIDLKFATSKFEDSNSNSQNNKSLAYGISPLIGIQFQLTPHLSLQTEASFNLYYQTNTFDSIFNIIIPNPFPGNFSQNFKTFGGYITIPNALLLVVEF